MYEGIKTMLIDIVTIGHSHGIRIPKSLLTHCGFQKSVELEVRNGEMILRKPIHPRVGWKDAFASESPIIDQEWLNASCDQSDEEWVW